MAARRGGITHRDLKPENTISSPGKPAEEPRNESDLQQQIRIALGSLPDLVMWRNSVGVTVSDDRKRRYGLCVGSSDLIGMLAPLGRLIALEVKTATGRTTPEQEKFIALVRRMGGFACVVRSVNEALAAVERAREGGWA